MNCDRFALLIFLSTFILPYNLQASEYQRGACKNSFNFQRQQTRCTIYRNITVPVKRCYAKDRCHWSVQDVKEQTGTYIREQKTPYVVPSQATQRAN